MHGYSLVKGVDEKYRYVSLLPSAEVLYRVSEKRKVHAQYVSNIAVPSMDQLNPVPNVSNPQYPVHGNPSLRPSYSQNTSIQYEFSSLKQTYYQGFQIGLTYATTKDLIIQNSIYPHDSTAVIRETRYENANGSRTLSLDYQIHFSPIIRKYLNMQLSGNINSSRNPIAADSLFQTSSTINWNQNLAININIPNRLEAGLFLGYGQTHNGGQSSSSQPLFAYFHWLLNARYELNNWMFSYSLAQSFASDVNGRFATYPTLMSSSLQYNLFPKSHARLGLSIYNLLNANTGVSQMITANSFSQRSSNQVGRHYMLTLEIKLERFKRNEQK